MLTDGRTDGAWPGLHWLQAWSSLCSFSSPTLLNLEASLARSTFSWVLWWARILGLRP